MPSLSKVHTPPRVCIPHTPNALPHTHGTSLQASLLLEFGLAHWI